MFFCIFLLMFSNKNGCARIKKLCQNVDGIFSEIFDLTENLVDFDVTCSVILGTVPYWNFNPFILLSTNSMKD